MPKTEGNASDLAARFLTAMQRGAVPMAVRTVYTLHASREGESASLKSYDAAGATIGDDRPYELLKACFDPMRARVEAYLVETRGQDLRAGEGIAVTLDTAVERVTVALS